MKSLRILPIATLLSVSAVFSSTSVQAFTPFGFTTQYSQDPSLLGFDATRDIQLNSATIGSQVVTNFTYVTGATGNSNPHSLGPFSSDHGDNTATDGFLPQGPVNEDPALSPSDIVASLGNRNLNSIIDGEDDADSSLDLFFAQPTNRLFFFERGDGPNGHGNSDLMVDLINASGTSLGLSYLITRDFWQSAGYSIDTTEISGAQNVGSYGLSYSGLIAGIRVSSKSDYNGPDFKVVGAYENRSVPAPSMLLGLGGLAVTQIRKARRRSQSEG
jgi:hypothetical protein